MMHSAGMQRWIVGSLLILSTLIPIGAAVLVVSSGADFSRLVSNSQQGLEEIGGHAAAFRASNMLGVAGVLLAVLGFGGLTGFLREAGDRLLAQLGLLAFLAAALLFVIDLAFHASVTVWAAQETVRTSAVPDIYFPLREWASTLQAITVVAGLVALLGYGGSILGTGWLPPWLGWACIGWGAIWLLLAIPGWGVPVGVVYIMPVVIGIVLLAQG